LLTDRRLLGAVMAIFHVDLSSLLPGCAKSPSFAGNQVAAKYASLSVAITGFPALVVWNSIDPKPRDAATPLYAMRTVNSSPALYARLSVIVRA